MDFRQLECFLAVAEELHFGRAAERLGMSQSSISESVKALEREIGGPLFDRTSRRVTLTVLGHALRTNVGPAVTTIRTTVRDCKRLARGETQTLKIGFLGGGLYELHKPFVAEFGLAHPEITLEFVELTYVTHFSAVQQGHVDIAFCRLPLGADSLYHGPIVLRDQRMLCVPEDHPFAQKTLLDPEELRQENLLRIPAGSVNEEWLDYHFPRHTPSGYPIGEGPEIRTVREAIAAVSAGQGLVMVTKRASYYYATPSVRFIEIDLPALPSAMVRRADDRRPILSELDRLLVRIAKRYGVM